MEQDIFPANTFTASKVIKMFQIPNTKQTLLNAEERGDIPTASRVQRGKASAHLADGGAGGAENHCLGHERGLS